MKRATGCWARAPGGGVRGWGLPGAGLYGCFGGHIDSKTISNSELLNILSPVGVCAGRAGRPAAHVGPAAAGVTLFASAGRLAGEAAGGAGGAQPGGALKEVAAGRSRWKEGVPDIVGMDNREPWLARSDG